MVVSTPAGMKSQRGVSITGLILVLAVLGFVGVTAAKIIPAYMEYGAIKSAIALAKSTGGTPREMQFTFDKNANVNNIEVISGRDLLISKETGETEISFSYEKRIPLVANTTLLIAYAGTTDKSGVVPARAAPEKP